MIKKSLFLFFNCLLLTSLVYSNTEVKPPEGPFVSLLRNTFTEGVSGTFNKVVLPATLGTEKKEYNFKVPDLGRYAERSPDKLPSNLSNQPQPVEIPVFEVKSFDHLPMVQKTRTPKITPFDRNSHTSPFTNQRLVKSFDDLPIVMPQNGENSYYPPEWGRPLNRVPQTNRNNSYRNSNNSNNSMMGPPFSNQMAPWIPSNQTNNRYQ